MLFEIIVFILILSFLVFIHELGHFSTAKFFGVKVEEFGMGLPPRAASKQIGGTRYSLNWLPIGGFVQIKGESYDGYDPADNQNFINKRPCQKLIILVAGVVMNSLFAVGVFYYTLSSNEWKSAPMVYMDNYQFPYGETVMLPVVIVGIDPESGSAQTDLASGDRILSISHLGNEVEISSVSALREFLSDKSGEEVLVNAYSLTTSTSKQVPVNVTYSEEIKGGALGVRLGEAVEVQYNESQSRFFAGFAHSINVLSYNFKILGTLISFSVENRTVEPVSQGIAGPVGIYDVVSSVLNSGTAKLSRDILDLSAMISLSLALMNLLPLPALDGGRIVFVLGEWITGKRASPMIEAKVHQVGFAILLTLIVLVTFKDIFQIFTR